MTIRIADKKHRQRRQLDLLLLLLLLVTSDNWHDNTPWSSLLHQIFELWDPEP